MAQFEIQPGENWQGVDARLRDIIQGAAESNLPGISRVVLTDGRAARATGTPNHPRGWAVDVKLYDDAGRELRNRRSASSFRAYEQFAQTAKQVQSAKHPDLDGKFTWGGYFQQGTAFDQMHFDIGGERGAYGSWATGLNERGRRALPGAESIGLRAGPNAVAAAGAQSFKPERRTIARTSSPEQIAGLQSALASVGAYKGEIDGKWGRQTQNAVERFQHASGLGADGLAGPQTQNALAEAIGGPAGADVYAGIQAHDPAAVGMGEPVNDIGGAAAGFAPGGLLGTTVQPGGLLGAPPRMAPPEQLAADPVYSAQPRPASEFAAVAGGPPAGMSLPPGVPFDAVGPGSQSTYSAAPRPPSEFAALPVAAQAARGADRLTADKQALLGTLTNIAASPSSTPDMKAWAGQQMDALANGERVQSYSARQAAVAPPDHYDGMLSLPRQANPVATNAADSANSRAAAAARLAAHKDMPDVVRQNVAVMAGTTAGQNVAAQSQEQRQMAAARRLADHPYMPAVVRSAAATMATSTPRTIDLPRSDYTVTSQPAMTSGRTAGQVVGDQKAEQRTRRDAGLPRTAATLPALPAPAITPAAYSPQMDYDAPPAPPVASQAINANFTGGVPAAITSPQPRSVPTTSIPSPPPGTPGYIGRLPSDTLPTSANDRIAAAFSTGDYGGSAVPAPQPASFQANALPAPPALPSVPSVTNVQARSAPVPNAMPVMGSAADAFSPRTSLPISSPPPISAAIHTQPAPAHTSWSPVQRALAGAGIGGVLGGPVGALAGGLLGGAWGRNPLGGLLGHLGGGNPYAGMQRTGSGTYSFPNGMTVNVGDMGAHPSGYEQMAELDAGRLAQAQADRINGRGYSGGNLPGPGVGGLW